MSNQASRMTPAELQPYVEAAGGKTALAARVGITERYVDMLLSGERQMSGRLEKLIRLSVKVKPRS